MAVEIGALRALLSLDSAAFEKGAKRARASMSGLERGLNKAAARMRSIGKRMSVGITAPLVGAVSLMVKSSLSTIDAQSKMAQSLGTSTASMQVLARAADRAGVSTGELEQVGRQLTMRLSQAATGTGPAVKALDKLGLKAGDLVKMDLDQQIAVINRAIAETVPEAERAAVAVQLFGSRAGIAAGRLDAATIAAANAELERFGVTVTEIEADRIEAANDAMSALGLVSRGLGNQLAVALAPALQAIAERLADLGAWFANLAPQMKQLIGIAAALAAAIGPVTLALGLMASGLSVAIGAARGLVAALFTLRGALMATGIGAVVVAAGVLANWLFKLVERTGSWGAALGLLGDVAGAVWQGIIDSAQAIPPALSGVWEKMKGGFSSALGSMAWKFYEWLGALGSLAGQSKLTEQLAGPLFDAATAAGELSSKMHDAADAANGAASGSFSNAAGIISDAFGPARDAVAALNAETADTTTGMDDAADAAAGLQAALDGVAGGGGGGGAGAGGGGGGGAAGRVKDAMSEIKDKTKGAADEMRTAFDDAAKSIGDAMAGAIVQGKSMGQALGQVFQQIAQDLISSGITRMITSLFGAALGGIGGGPIAQSVWTPGRASGGPVSRGRPYMVGEQGPELMVPNASGTIIPNHKLPQGGGGQMNVQVVPSPYFDVVVDHRAQNVAAPMVGGMARAQTRAHGSQSQRFNRRGTMT